MKEVENLKAVIAECYSEHLLSGNNKSEREGVKAVNGVKDAPDAGLGMLFRYPGDARKLRDRSKMRLWGEYLRGRLVAVVGVIYAEDSNREWSKCHSHTTTQFP